MKFYCDRCNAKYSISDEKVRGKVVKVECKRCGDVIEVSEEKNQSGGSVPDDSGGRSGASDGGDSDGDWYYSVEGQTFGPVAKEDLIEKYDAGELSANSYVWRDSFSDWKPATDVEPFGSILQDQTEEIDGLSRERKGTMGVGDSIESVEEAAGRDGSSFDASLGDETSAGGGSRTSGDGRRSGGGREESSGSTRGDGREGRRGGRSRRGGSSGRSRDASRGGNRRSSRSSRSDDESGSSSDRKERLERLRGKLKSNFDPEDESDSSGDETSRTGGSNAGAAAGGEPDPGDRGLSTGTDGGGVGSAAPAVGSSAPDSSARAGRESEPRDSAMDGLPSPDEGAGFESDDDATVDVAPEDLPALEEIEGDTEEEDEGGDWEQSGDDDFSLPPSGGSRVSEQGEEVGPGEELVPENRDRGDEAELFEEAEDEAASLPTAPKLGDHEEEDQRAAGHEGMTQSLLIQLDKIQEQSSKTRYIGGAAAAALVLLVGGLSYFIFFSSDSPDEASNKDEKQLVLPEQDDAKQETYSEEEILAIRPQKVEKQKKGESSGDESEAARGSAAAPGGSKTGGSGDEEDQDDMGLGDEPLLKTESPEVDEAVSDSKAGSGSDESGDRSESGTALAAKEEESTGSIAGTKQEEDESSNSDDFEAMQAVDGKSPSVDNPTAATEDSNDQGGGMRLSKEQIKRGVKDIRRSIQNCRQRQRRRGAPMDVAKIYLTVHIRPTGSVDDYGVTPDKVQGTVFERCLSSHKGRWDFGSFPGSSTQKLKAPFILQ